MHGRKRAEYKALQRDAKVAAKLAAKSVAWHALQAELLERRRATYSSAATTSQAEPDTTTAAATATTTLQLIEKAVSVNPDPLWLWNFRSELVLGRTEGEEDTIAAVVALDWEREQRVTQAALQANPKSYGAWHYRKRCLQQYLLLLQNKKNSTIISDPAAAVLEQELELTSLFFQRDERNFHCWSYRRFVVSCCLWIIGTTTAESSTAPPPPVGEWRLDHDDGKLWMGAQISRSSNTPDTPASSGETATRTAQQDERVTAILEKEWAFTEDKIRDNFSNFSAFHYRSKLLPVLVERRSSPEQHSSSLSEMTTTMVASELELVLNAVFTEPDDQTAWWYQRFLLDFMTSSSSISPSHSSSSSNDGAVAVNEFQNILQPHMDQLRELQAEYPTGKWVLTGVLQCLQHGSSSSSSSLQENTVAEQCRILEQLIAIDPDRTGRYQYLLRQTKKEVEGTST